ncbi:MAG: LPD23 domain-containing protein, partial [Hyphomonadaceae bacterium]
MFIGPTAKTWDAQAAARAEAMEAAGANADDIWRETGTGRGADGKWRQEIDDSRANVSHNDAIRRRMAHAEAESRVAFDASVVRNRAESLSIGLDEARAQIEGELRRPIEESAMQMARTNSGATLRQRYQALEDQTSMRGARLRASDMTVGETTNHPELLSAYPDLASRPHGSPALGMGGPGVRGGYSEGDDAIYTSQFIKGEEERSTGLHELQHAIQAREATARGANGTDAAYPRVAGEVEARNVQTRRDFTPEERRAKPPWTTEDIPRSEQIVRFDGGEAQSVEGRIARGAALRKAAVEGREQGKSWKQIASELGLKSHGNVERAYQRARAYGETGEKAAPTWTLDDVEGLTPESRAAMERQRKQAGLDPNVTSKGQPRQRQAPPAEPLVTPKREAEGDQGPWRWARPGDPQRSERFYDPRLSPAENKVVEMGRNGLSRDEIIEEMGFTVPNQLDVVLSDVRKKGAHAPHVEVYKQVEGHTPLADLVRARDSVKATEGRNALNVLGERFGMRPKTIGIRLWWFDKAMKGLREAKAAGTPPERMVDDAAKLAGVEPRHIRQADNALRVLKREPYLPALVGGAAGAGAGAALSPQDAEAATGEGDGSGVPGWVFPAALGAGGGLMGIMAVLRARQMAKAAKLAADRAETDRVLQAIVPTRRRTLAWHRGDKSIDLGSGSEPPPSAVNAQLSGRPHGKRADRILREQDAKEKAGRAAVKSLNQDTKKAFELLAEAEGNSLEGMEAAYMRSAGADQAALNKAKPFAAKVGPAQETIDDVRRADLQTRAGDRLADPDFNPPRNRWNVAPWVVPATAAAGAAALAPNDAHASTGEEGGGVPGWVVPAAIAAGGAVGYGALVRGLRRSASARADRIERNLADATASMNRTAENYSAASTTMRNSKRGVGARLKWTPAQEAELTRLWNEGLTPQQIANTRAMREAGVKGGADVSLKAWRLGLMDAPRVNRAGDKPLSSPLSNPRAKASTKARMRWGVDNPVIKAFPLAATAGAAALAPREARADGPQIDRPVGTLAGGERIYPMTRPYNQNWSRTDAYAVEFADGTPGRATEFEDESGGKQVRYEKLNPQTGGFELVNPYGDEENGARAAPSEASDRAGAPVSAISLAGGIAGQVLGRSIPMLRGYAGKRAIAGLVGGA